MRRVRLLLALALLSVPGAARAIQLHWSSGADTLTFSEATRAILVLGADAAEVTLPPEWRLLWVTDGSEVGIVALDSLEVCAGDTARVYGVAGPVTPADSTANLVTARFCSAGGGVAARARYVLDLPAGGRGKLKVVALDPGDSTTVLQSNEVTFNGGVSDSFPPAILLVTSTHGSWQLQVAAVGAGLDSVRSVKLTAADGLWSVPLTIVSQTSSTITATADVPAVLPASVLEASGPSKVVSLGSVAADEIETGEISYPDTILFRDPNPAVYPKDFAFFYNVVPSGNPLHPWKGLFHLVYIRHNRNLSGDAQEPCLAHAWSESLRDWRVDTLAFLPNAGWDAVHVWAPSIVQVGNLYYMFYTGVDLEGDQRIGYATTALLDTTNTRWERQSSWVYSSFETSWADTAGLGCADRLQFRDPFVMTDPDSIGRYLMFVVGQDRKFGASCHMIVGVARNEPGTLGLWKDCGAYRATDYAHTGIEIGESPLVCRDSSGTGAWRIFLTNGLYNEIGSNSQYFVTEVPDSSVADTTLASWPDLDNMYTYLGSDGALLGWAACEHLRVGTSDFFAGYNGDGIAITQAHWDPTTGIFVIGYPSLAGTQDGSPAGSVRFYLSRCRPGESSVGFEVDLPGWVSPRLVIYDIAGRRVRTLVDGQAMQGRREFRWDCRDSQGVLVASGVYFARLTDAGVPQALCVPVLR